MTDTRKTESEKFLSALIRKQQVEAENEEFILQIPLCRSGKDEVKKQ